MTSNYFERITLFDLSQMIIMTDLVAPRINVKTPRIDCGCFLED